MKDYKIYWADMHANLHHEQIDSLEKWYEQLKETTDFWPIAYYPYHVRKDETGIGLEDIHDKEIVDKDWETIREFTNKVNKEGFPMFMGFEWQGSGEDGDHNVFFKDNNQNIINPLRYEDLYKAYENKGAIAIPHHTAYYLNHRGKNWDTHKELFSPFAEIYSSHGSSENDETCIPMDRHIHMGPRCDSGSLESGWKRGFHLGCIASGDNHSVPGVYGFGLAAAIAKSNSKEDIFDAFINRRVYGISKDKIELDYTIDDSLMGSIIESNKEAKLKINIIGSNALDRVELIDTDKTVEMIPHIISETRKENTIRFKFKLEFGWGPDRKVFEDIESKIWHGKLETNGKILSIQKCWSNFGQKIINQDDKTCEFEITSYKTTATGKWMGPSAVTTEGFIFEIETDVNSSLSLIVDNKKYELKVTDILEGSFLLPLLDESNQLIKERFGFEGYYRSDPFWHNAYKIKVNRGALEEEYTKSITMTIDTTKYKQLRLRVWQKNGAVAWSSPIFFK